MTAVEPCDFARISVEELPQARRIAQWMLGSHPNARILDVGCGPGLYVEEMRRVGLEANGFDNDARVLVANKAYLQQIDITDNEPPVGFDVVLSLEVGEHISKNDADRYINFVTRNGANVVYFSAARPGQGGEGHINLQPKAYWVEKMHRAGFWLDPDATDAFVSWLVQGEHMGWLRNNFMLLRRG
jgi:SAM-dependent methyltransferase